MKTIYCVTGAAGHLGTAITKQLVAKGKPTRIFVLPNELNLPDESVEVFYGDVTQKQSLEAFLSYGADEELIVIHCAGIVSIASSYNQKVVDVNVGGTKNVVDLCVEKKVKKLVYVSSVHAIPEKGKGVIMSEIDHFDSNQVIGLYAKTKSEATAYALEATTLGLDVSVVHPSGICGPYDYGKGHMTSLIIDYMKGNLTAGMNGGYDFVDVSDVAAGTIACATLGRTKECYILSNEYIKVSTILDLLFDITGKRKIKTMLPLWFVKLTAKLAETYYRIRKESPLFTVYSIYVLGSNSLFSHEKATKELGYATRNLKETLEDTISWLDDHNRF